MHFMKGTATYVYLMIAILAAALTLAAAQEETPAPAPAPMKCFQCTSKENENCLDVSKLSATECTDDTFTKCYTKNDAGVITRGCLGKDDTTTCPAEGCKSCTATADGGCNNQNICKKCSTDDANCSQTDASDAKYNDICDSSTAQCYVNVTDKKVERRCAASSDACADGTTTTCNKCSGVNCNAGIFPKDRIECYQCSGANCVDTTSLSTKPCANYVAADECFMFPDDAKTVTRGCKSDDSSKCADSAKEGCQTCTETKCNNWKYDTEFKCIVCRSDIDARCWNKADELSGSTCRNGDSSIEEGCFHGIWNGVAIRGCYIDADEKTKVTCSDKENKQCEVCNTGANCNKEKSSGAGSVTIFMGLVVTMISAIWYLN